MRHSSHSRSRCVRAVLVSSAVAAVAVLTAAAGTAPSSGAGTPLPRLGTATQQVVVRPVHADGTPAAQWTVTRQSGSTDCWGSSRAAVNRGIAECGPTAYYLPSCWRSRDHTVLCVRDLRRRELVRIRWTGTWPATPKPDRPSPQNLQLGDGQRCDIRLGGAWSAPTSHPRWFGYYSCDRSTVYGPGSRRDGIIRSTTPWRVDTWVNGTDGTIVRRRVTAAYYVGTRR